MKDTLRKEVHNMGLLWGRMTQFQKPTGNMGRFLGKAMNISHGQLRQWGLSFVTVKNDDVILDVGCGGGRTVNFLAKMAGDGKVHGIDYSEDMVNLARDVNQSCILEGKVNIHQGSVSDLPFKDESFNLVTAFETTYFWPNIADDLKEILRILKPGGLLLVANEAFNDSKYNKKNSYMTKHYNMQIYTPSEYMQFFTAAGYVKVEIHTERPGSISVIGRKAIPDK